MTWQAEPPGERIVVGVGGSPSSRAAMKWAVGQAALSGSTVEAVIAWHYPAMYGGYGCAPVSAADPVSKVAEGNPAQVLLEAAKGADLLVVGSRGHGGFAGALLGSVSQHCATHSPGPIVIVRGKDG